MIILYHTIKYNNKINYNETKPVLRPTDNHSTEHIAH